jgi:hypothetical protein
MADRYWVGGTGTWSSTNTANWSASSGGASGASVPTATDNVFFDANSNTGTGAFTVTMATTPRVCNDITISGLDGAMTLAGASIGLTVSGSLSFPATNFTRTYTGTTTFNATTTGKTITTNGVAFGAAVTFNGVGGGWQLQDALTTASTAAVTLTAGSLDLNGKTLTGGTFVGDGSSTRSIAFGSTGSIVLTTTSGGSTVLDIKTATNFTFTGTSNISAAMSVTRTFNFGGTAGATTSNRLNINLTSGASVPTFTGSFRQINFTGSTCNPGLVTISCHGFTLASGGTYTSTDFTTVGDGTITFVGKTIRNLTINGSGITTTLGDNGSVSGTTDVTLTAGTLALSSYTLTTPSFSSSNTNTRSINFGTGTIAISTPSPGTIWTTSTTTGLTISGTPNVTISSTYGGTSTTRIFPGSPSESNTISFNFITTYPLNIDMSAGGAIRDFKITAGAFSLSNQRSFSIGTIAVAGNLEFTNANLDLTNLSLVMAATSGTKTILCFANYFVDNCNLNFNGIGGTWQLLSNVSPRLNTTTFTNGTVDLNGYTLFTASAATAAGTKNLTFNGGTLDISASTTTAWNNANPTGFTTTAGIGTGKISMTSGSFATFVGGGSIYNCALDQRSPLSLLITGANTFNDIISSAISATMITFPHSTTTTVNAFTLSGSAGKLVSLRSSSSGTKFTLSKSSGTVNSSYLNIQDSNATGGATWKALISNGNVNSGNNLGWLFANYVDAAASVTADATVTGFPTRIRLFAVDISANAAIASLASRIRLFAGDITANASVEGQGIRIRVASGDVTGNATIICGANKVVSGAASVTGFAQVSAYGSATYSFNPVVTATADVVANGQIVGEEWGDTTPTSSTWTTSSPAVSGWSNVAGTSSTWLRQ